jgi:hypothetical protein
MPTVGSMMCEVLVAEYVICSQPECGCHVGGVPYGPFWRSVWLSGDRDGSRFIHRADARLVAELCGRGRARRLRGRVRHTGSD